MLLPLLLVLSLSGAPALAADPGASIATRTTISGSSARAGDTSTLRVRLTDAGGAPLGGQPVAVRRRVDGAWTAVAEVVTDARGRASTTIRLAPDAADNVVAADFAGTQPDPTSGAGYAPSTSGRVAVALVRRDSRVRLSGPGTVVDGRSATLTVSWTAVGSGEGVAGRVRLQQRVSGRWRTIRRVKTGRDGVGRTTLTPRQDVRLRARAPRLDWVHGDVSGVHRIDNLPPARPVRLPAAAPRPRVNLPDQRRAVGEGANVVVSRIPARVWRQMTGVTWHRGCPVGRAGLRLIRANYYDYAGYRRRGELVVAAGAAGQFAGALRGIHAAKLPLRSMYRVDRFGWSRRLQGGDDYRSMAAGNTSAFNCRSVVGRPGVRSPHSYGRSFDINPWENPYRASHGWVPNTWWVGRSHPRVAWRSRGHRMVEILTSNGFSWTYGTADAHHFDARGGSGRTMRVPGCPEGEVCH